MTRTLDIRQPNNVPNPEGRRVAARGSLSRPEDNRTMRVLMFLLSVVVVASCESKGPTEPSPVDQRVTLVPGQTLAVSEAAIALTFEGVSGDSRCPLNATCITGGDAQVGIEVLPARGNRANYVLHTGDMRPVKHDDLTITLVDLSPYPFAGRPTDPRDYRATLHVTR